ncbi:MAG TPA: hypothetical protein VFY71_17720 [Planctomycetota bacterium]|nr:hypothetical protein [Planctomycetota bacterium]
MERDQPVCLAFLVCERVEYDAVAGRHALVGLFEDMTVSGVPATCPSLLAYAELTGMTGPVDLVLRLVQLLPGPDSEGRPRSARPIRAWNYPNPVLLAERTVAKIGIQLHEVKCPEAGHDLFILEANATPLVARRFTVNLARRTT